MFSTIVCYFYLLQLLKDHEFIFYSCASAINFLLQRLLQKVNCPSPVVLRFTANFILNYMKDMTYPIFITCFNSKGCSFSVPTTHNTGVLYSLESKLRQSNLI